MFFETQGQNHPNGNGAKRRILVVDDSRDSAYLITKLLERRGHEVAFELSGDAALKSAFVPDLVFLDLAMPDMDGYELARCLKQRRPMKLVALTGYPRGQSRGDDSLFDEYLLKPVKGETLWAVVERLTSCCVSDDSSVPDSGWRERGH